ncbi:type I polyketide synthase [Actinokineospora sp. HUAS TT18]|uniref:type I polyketide synthase n=1 Tax=Actinokineospora sp. HUAS TT18 TaxID=3447451 RepID=UPI003F5223FA
MSTETAELAAARATIREQDELIGRLLRAKHEPIAIVGLGLRFPGDNDTPAALAEFLDIGGVGTGPFPADRWDVSAFAADAAEKGRINSAGGGFLTGIDEFDGPFFTISPKEARCLDPQQRLVMETTWAALEHANIDPTRLRHGTGGVYFGASSMDYALELGALADEDLDGYLAAGILHAGVSGRMSYFLGLRGPSITLDTACSASLVALHLAVQGLRGGECEIALCGGVNAIHHPLSTALLSDMQALAADGRCKTFDESADGYARSEGCGVLVLKRLSDAERDGDTVLALIRGSAVRQDGESAGLTAPNGTAQVALMRAALASAALTPADISYVEAHGTGTPLGDPIEMAALDEVFRDSHTADDPLLVASLKTNIGHMEAAAGVGGVVKTVLQLQRATVYPHLNVDTPSGRIPWDTYPVRVPDKSEPWQAPVRRAMVNSFGFTGTIASVVLEQAPAPNRPTVSAETGGVFTVSAKSAPALADQLRGYQRLLADSPDLAVADLCYTANVGRAHFRHRVAGLVRDRDDLAALLARSLETESTATAARKVAFLFTGQGAQYAGMGAGAYRRYPAFAEALDECDRLLTPLVGRSVKDLVLDPAAPDLDETRYTQPALFAVEYATARLWLSWGIRPTVLIGHSIGEVVAATVAGLFSLADAARLVAARGRLMGSVRAPGGMISVPAALDDVADLVDAYPDVAVAAVNAPGQTVLSGGDASLTEITAALADRDIAAKRLTVSHAFHSPLMAEVVDEFRAAIADIEFRQPEVTLVSTVTGQVARWRELADVDYWVRQIVAPVDFLGAARAAQKRGKHVFIEVGPGSTLTSLAKRCVTAADHTWLTSLRRSDVDAESLPAALAKAYTAGLAVSWPDFHAGAVHRKVDLPTYPFERKKYWLATETQAERTPAASAPKAEPVRLDPEALADPARRRPAVEDLIQRVLAAAMDFAHPGEVGIDADFGELGMDSLVATELRNALTAALPVPCPASAVFDHPSVRRLAGFLEDQFVSERIG